MDQEKEVDFVILWVDGSDEAWQREKMKYRPDGNMPDAAAANAAKCFRDWGTLKYWFRGVEKWAPWVRKIHFVTWGHLPAWLNTDHPKLHIVRHGEFMPEGSLPVILPPAGAAWQKASSGGKASPAAGTGSGCGMKCHMTTEMGKGGLRIPQPFRKQIRNRPLCLRMSGRRTGSR